MSIKLYTPKVGAGVRVRVSTLSPRDNRGTITAHICPGGSTVVTKDNLASIAAASMPLIFPGTSMPREYVDAILLKGHGAILTARYNSGVAGSGGFRRVMSREISGYRTVKAYDLSNGQEYTKSPANYIDYDNAVLRPTLINAPLIAVRWSDTNYADQGPGSNDSLVGKYNSNNYTIDTYPYAPEVLKFAGTEIVHEKYGGIDRWVQYHAAVADPLFRWRDDYVVRGVKRALLNGKEQGYEFTRPDPNGVHPNDASNLNLMANFPNLP